MDKYEISLWEDYQIEGESFFRERKIAVIGSNTMKAQARALEPNLVEEINGTNTFTFKMYYTYTDNQTGEKYDNPFGKYLINERKVKVFWKDKWYDLVIKKCQEDSAKKSVTYTCKDLFINELSKQGYSLEFDTELQNNIGTAAELAKEVLDGSTWRYDDNASTPIIQKTEGPVYEVQTITQFEATKQSPYGDEEEIIAADKKILVFYDSLINLLNITEPIESNIQFLYSADGYQTDINDMVVINGNCYMTKAIFTKSGDTLIASINNVEIFNIDLNAGVSNQYTANRLIKSQRTEYDPVLNRYVLLCEDNEHNKVYEINATEYTSPLAITNLISNPSNFSNVQGWIGNVGRWDIYPKFNQNTNISTYTTKSYLNLQNGWTYNSGIQGNIQYFTPNNVETSQGIIGGIVDGEKYIFRIKAKNDVNNAPNVYLSVDYNIEFNMFLYNPSTYHKISEEGLFEIINSQITSDNWIEYTLIAKKSVSTNDLDQYGLFIHVDGINCIWVEEAQFFKYAEGITSYDEDAEVKRINPGEINLQSIAKEVYKYYYPSDITDPNDLTYVYIGEEESPDYLPVNNNYEKIGTIVERESNRFNILQSIAETFQAWVKFRIDHEDNGEIKIVDGVPQKFVYFIEELERDNGLSFEYGIDLKTITRTIDSDKLATKILVIPNNNEFAPSGFCAIARSNENYTKENFILNLDYFVQQNLLDNIQLNNDLYGVDDKFIGYYYYLHQYNTEYDNLTNELVVKQMDLLKQNSQKKVYEQYLSAAQQQLENNESDLMHLANVSTWDEVTTYAKSHTNNEKVQSLLNAHGQLIVQINDYQTLLEEISTSISTLNDFISQAVAHQDELVNLIKAKHKAFNDKYTNYLMEGTWEDENYIDDTKYYLDGLKVAYTSSRPQLSYNINVLRLSSIEEYSSKVFELGDICYIQDREFFGYLSDGITPYKEKILVSKISSFFDSREKDGLTVQNYKTRFDDLFQRITATTQSLQYAEGSFRRAADSVTPTGTIDSTILQNTFDSNTNFVLSSSNQNVVWDDTGITVTDKFDSASKTRILAGGIFVTNDGGITWKNAIRGTGISTDLLTAGRINTNEIYIYDGDNPSFRWDSYGLTAYSYRGAVTDFRKFVRFDKYGIYGYSNEDSDFVPSSEQEIRQKANFGLIWDGFFLKNSKGDSLFEISTENDLIITNNGVKRVQLGRLIGEQYGTDAYGIILRDGNGEDVFVVNTNSEFVKLAGWSVASNQLYYEYTDTENNEISYTYLKANGTIESGVRAIDEENWAPDWSIGPTGISINQDGAIINIGNTTIDATGIYTGYLIAGAWRLESDGLYYYDQAINPFNLNLGQNIEDESDLDFYTECGTYYGKGVAASQGNHRPVSVAFKLIIAYVSSYIDEQERVSYNLIQILYPEKSTTVYKRYYNAESEIWSGWSSGEGGGGSSIAIQPDEPQGDELIWIETDNSGTEHIIPEVKDNEVSEYDTWSSQKIRDFVYPIGSIYISVNATSPADIFGGVWERITGRFLLGATDNGAQGGNSNASIAPGYTGGEASHTLTIDEMPSHNHALALATTDASLSSYARFGYNGETFRGSTGNSGGGGAHNNMPPYLAVYIWKRIE